MAMIVLRQSAKLAIIAMLVIGPPAALAADAAITPLAFQKQKAHDHNGIGTPLPAPTSSTKATAPPGPGAPPTQLLVPDLIAVLPNGITAAQADSIIRLAGVRAVLAVDGGRIHINGKPATVLGVPAQQFRSWTPPVTAAATGVWTALIHGDLITTDTAATRLGLTLGGTYQVSAATTAQVPFTATAPTGIPGADAIVDQEQSARLGLARDAAILINSPGADYATLIPEIRSLLGRQATVVNLHPYAQPTGLPVAPAATTARPANYLQLYQDSAAEYCPGLSWTVLAAIGEIESGDGVNDGPSSTGALGPMQFMPGTWAQWGTDGFGDTGTPDIMNPFDAVPSAARMLCADGATAGPAGLAAAVFDYNHADWYVTEVLDLAGEYAQEYH